jgi:hypothetical protein
MGYRCPVCATPTPDGEHLANHLAMTALLHDDEHAVWLDEHAPDWTDEDPAGLGERVTEFVPEADLDLGTGTEPVASFESALAAQSGEGRASDPATQAALEQAREWTAQLHGDDGTDGTAAPTDPDTEESS